MKLTITSVSLFLICNFNLFAQKAKINSGLVGFKYEIYPEIDGYEDYSTFDVSVKDKNGLNYGFSTGNTKEAMNKDLYMGFDYLSGLRYNHQVPQLLIKIEQLSHDNEQKK